MNSRPNIAALPAILLVAMAFNASCGRRAQTKRIPAAPAPAAMASVPIGYSETGTASWYGEPYHRRRAANGEVYDMNQLTAAHKRLPFGTWVRVDNLTNAKKTQVRITDRGPFVGDRIIDLSRKAAEEIAMIGPGTAKVKLTVIPPPAAAGRSDYAVQVIAVRQEERARAVEQELARKGIAASTYEREGTYRVVAVGGNEEAAKKLAEKIRALGHRPLVLKMEQAPGYPQNGVSPHQ